MGCVKWMTAVAVVSIVSGCAGAPVKGASSYEAGYRKGVAENLGNMVETLNGNDFPYIAGTWAEPLVQEVLIPAHVRGGVFYPEHKEMVVITPGEWKKQGAFPLCSGKTRVMKGERHE